MKTKLYMDIDGVLLHTKRVRVPEFAEEFIDYVTTHFDCYWLTTHCKGDANGPLGYLSQYYDSNVIERLKGIKPTTFDVLKTDAICFDEDFYWLDDSPFNAELAVLRQYGCEGRCIVVNLSCQDELRRIKLMLEDCVSFVVKLWAFWNN